jgi:transcriptional regulator with XRE-family HTH domain
VKKMDKPVKKTDCPTKRVGRPAKKVGIAQAREGYTAFYTRYVEACRKRAVATSAVAIAIGENNSAANRWKNGVIPNAAVLLKLSEYLGVSMDYLMGNDIHVYTPEEREFLKIFRSLPASQKYALLSVANKLKEEDTCLDVSVKKKTSTEVNHNYV